MYRAKYYQGTGGGQSFHALSRHTTLPALPCFYQTKSSLNPVVKGFYGYFIT